MSPFFFEEVRSGTLKFIFLLDLSQKPYCLRKLGGKKRQRREYGKISGTFLFRTTAVTCKEFVIHC